jgi:hypothetical protein
MAQVSTAWILAKEGKLLQYEFPAGHLTKFFKGVSAPIIGTTSLKNLEDILGRSFFVVLAKTRSFTRLFAQPVSTSNSLTRR